MGNKDIAKGMKTMKKIFKCACCGNCCRWEGVVHVRENELPPIAHFLGISVEEFIDKYTRLSSDRKGLVYADKPDGSCMFQDENNLCTINPVKPLQCATFPYDWEIPEEHKGLCQGHWVEVENEHRSEIGLVHVLGHPSLPLDIAGAPADAQLFNCRNFCQMLSYLGIPFIYYGVPGSVVPEGGRFVSTGKPTGRWAYRNAWHRTYNARLNRLLKKNVVEMEKPQLIASLYGASQSGIEDFGLPVLEPMVGYDHCWAPYRVFPSYAQQNIIYATQAEYTWNTRYFDAVIPHFVQAEEYFIHWHPENYLLYLGRNASDKGIDLARQVAKEAGLELKMVHDGVWGREKALLLSRAKAVLMPTIYPEPFGYVAIEAQMCGTPVLTTDWGAFPETVINGKTGFRCRTAAEFAKALELVDGLDRLAIRKSAIERYSLEKIAPFFERYFLFVWNVHKNGGYYAMDAIGPCFPWQDEQGPLNKENQNG